MLPVDYLLFGEEVPSQSENSYSWLKKWTQRIDMGFESADYPEFPLLKRLPKEINVDEYPKFFPYLER